MASTALRCTPATVLSDTLIIVFRCRSFSRTLGAAALYLQGLPSAKTILGSLFAVLALLGGAAEPEGHPLTVQRTGHRGTPPR